MATELGTYYVSLVPSAMNITGHAQKAFAPVQGIADRAGSESGGRFSSAFSRATSGLGNALGAALKVGTAAATGAIVAAGAIGIKTAAQLETAQISFTTMLGSAEKATSFMQDLKRFAAKTPFDLPGLQTAAQSLISIGIGSEKVLPIMTTLGNVTSGMGTGSEGIKRATVALQQMNAAGKITAEDLNQLRDAGIPVYDLLTAATGKTTAQISEMRDKGELGREELEALMSALETGKGFERFNGLMEAQSASLSGLWSTLKDTFGVGMAEAMQPLLPAAKAALGGTVTFLQDTAMPGIKSALQTGVDGFSGFVAVMNDPYLRTESNGFVGFMRDLGRFVAMSGIPDGLRFIGESIRGVVTNIHLAGGAVEPLSSGGVVSNAILHFGTVLGNGINVLQTFWAVLSNPKASTGALAMSGMDGLRLGAAHLAETLRGSMQGIRAFFLVLNDPEADVTSGGIVGYLENIGMKVRDFLTALDWSSWGNFWTSVREELGPVGDNFASIKQSVSTLGPAIGMFASQVGAIGPNVAMAGLDIFAAALGFLANHVDTIIRFMPLIVAGFVAWKVAQMGVNVVTAASVPLMVAANVARTAAAIAEFRLVGAQRAAITAGVAHNTIENVSLTTRLRATVATVAHNGAVLASAAATRVASAAQWLWNAAMSANPIAMIIKGIALLTAGAVWFFTQTDIGRGIVAGAWAMIQGAIGGVVDWFQTTALPFITGFFGAIGSGATGAQANTGGAFAGIQNFIGGVVNWFQTVALPIAAAFFAGVGNTAMWLWTNAIQPAFAGIQTAIGIAWGIISGIFNAWVFVFSEIVFPIVRALWEDVVRPVFELAWGGIKLFWGLAFGIFQILVSVLQNIVFPAFMALWNAVVKPVFEGIGNIIGFIWNNIVSPIFWAWINFIVGTLTPPLWTFLGVIRTVWDNVSGAIGGAWNWVKDHVFAPMDGFLNNDLPAMWEKATGAIGTAWDAIQGVAKKPIKWVIENVINKGVVDTFNNIAGKLPGVKKLDPVKLPDGWARGGVLPGYRTTKSDDVLTPMRSGEGVLVPEAVRGIGPDTIHALNAAGNRGGVAAVHSLLSNGLALGGIAGDDEEEKRKRRRGKRPPTGAVFAGGPGTPVFGQSSFGNELQRAIFASRRMFVYKQGIPGSYNFDNSANKWNGIANLEVIPINGGNARGKTGGLLTARGAEAGAGIAGWYQGNNIVLDTPGMGPNGDPLVAVHELGHALGLPHAHRWSANGQGGGDGTHSVMNYDTQWSIPGANPTAGDRRALKAIYPGIVKGKTQGREVSEEDGGGFNPFQGLIDGVAGLLKGAFPDGGMFVDAAVGTGKKALDDVASWVLDKIGGFWDWLGGGGGDKGGPKPSGDVNSWATEGLKRTGAFDGANLASLTRRIMQESSGDPRAVNMWDSNAALGGTHGLMQLLKSNFDTYRDGGLINDIYNPLANVVAGINYTKNRYGGNLRGGWDRPGGYALGGIVPTLFDTGGYLPKGPSFVNNERQHPEMILTDQQWSAMYDIADNVAGSNKQPIYVQNPFTAEYMAAKTEDYAVSATGNVLQGTLRRTRRGGKYAGSRR